MGEEIKGEGSGRSVGIENGRDEINRERYEAGRICERRCEKQMTGMEDRRELCKKWNEKATGSSRGAERIKI